MKKDKSNTKQTFLSEISLKKNAFKVPENYFETIENQTISAGNLLFTSIFNNKFFDGCFRIHNG